MKRYLLSIILSLLISPAAFAEEYLIRVETVGYEDVPVSEKVPEDQVLTSIEVFANSNQTFRSKARLGPETLILEGMLKPEAGGRFSLEIKCRHTVDTRMTIPAVDGNREPVLHVTGIQNKLTLELDRSVTFGELTSQSTEIVDGKKTDVESKVHHVLSVTRRKPEHD